MCIGKCSHPYMLLEDWFWVMLLVIIWGALRLVTPVVIPSQYMIDKCNYCIVFTVMWYVNVTYSFFNSVVLSKYFFSFTVFLCVFMYNFLFYFDSINTFFKASSSLVVWYWFSFSYKYVPPPPSGPVEELLFHLLSLFHPQPFLQSRYLQCPYASFVGRIWDCGLFSCQWNDQNHERRTWICLVHAGGPKFLFQSSSCFQNSFKLGTLTNTHHWYWLVFIRKKEQWK